MKVRVFRLFFLIPLLGIVVMFPACRKKATPEQWLREVRQKKILTGHTGMVLTLAVSPKGNLLASSDSNGKLLFWDLTKDAEKIDPNLRNSEFYALSFSPDGKYLAGGGKEKSILLLDTEGFKLATGLAEVPDEVLALSWSPDRTLAVGTCGPREPRGFCTEGQISFWRFGEKLIEFRRFRAHQQYVNTLAFSFDGKYLASGSMDKEIIIWDPMSAKPITTLSGHEHRVNVLVFSQKDPNLLISASLDGTVRLWNIAEAKVLNILHGQQGFVYGLALRPDSSLIASGGSEKKIVIWDLKTGEKLKELTGLNGQVLNLAFSPDGKDLFAGLDDGTIVVFGI